MRGRYDKNVDPLSALRQSCRVRALRLARRTSVRGPSPADRCAERDKYVDWQDRPDNFVGCLRAVVEADVVDDEERAMMRDLETRLQGAGRLRFLERGIRANQSPVRSDALSRQPDAAGDCQIFAGHNCRITPALKRSPT